MGCVFVKSIVGGEGTVGIDGNRGGHELLSTGFNATNATRNGTRHAEMVAIDDIILKQGHDPSVFRDCDLYVTCEVICEYCYWYLFCFIKNIHAACVTICLCVPGLLLTSPVLCAPVHCLHLALEGCILDVTMTGALRVQLMAWFYLII